MQNGSTFWMARSFATAEGHRPPAEGTSAVSAAGLPATPVCQRDEHGQLLPYLGQYRYLKK